MAPEWTTRTNAAYALGLICSEFQRTLKPRLLESKSDGDLLYLDDLDVGKIYNCGYSTELLGGHSTYVEDAKTDNKLYGKKWLRRQRRALQKRLGLELGTDSGGDAEVTMGLGYVAKGDEGVVEDERLLLAAPVKEKVGVAVDVAVAVALEVSVFALVALVVLVPDCVLLVLMEDVFDCVAVAVMVGVEV
jgi:hypothetical protein